VSVITRNIRMFDRYIGIDYSGAMTPSTSLKGLRVFIADKNDLPTEVSPPPSPRKYWNRQEVAQWLTLRLSECIPTIIGIDHAFSFPLKYFETHLIEADWSVFLKDFIRHWPTHEKDKRIDSIRYGKYENGTARSGNPRWRRISEERVGAKSVFHFDVPGSVAKSSHAGIPWLHHIRTLCKETTHFWPFEGWNVKPGKSVIAEAYPSLWNKSFTRSDEHTQDQHDAFVIASWLQQVDDDGRLSQYLEPSLRPEDKAIAEVEGWILGVL
jgi:hypothetical protein